MLCQGLQVAGENKGGFFEFGEILGKIQHAFPGQMGGLAALEDFCSGTKLYTCNADRFRQIVDRVEARHIPPERIAEKTKKILQKRNPGFAYAINRNPLLLLLNILPKGLQLWAIRLVLK